MLAGLHREGECQVSPVAIIDIVFVIASLAVIIFVLIGKGLRRDVKLVLAGLALFTFIYSVCLYVEWSHISDALDRIEDIVGATIPLWWAFVFYAIRQDLMTRALDASEQKAQAVNQQLRSLNQQLQASEQQLRASNQQLQAGEEKYRLLFTEMTSGFALHEIICDENEEPCDYRFIEVNPAFEKLTGFSREQLVGKTVRQVMPGTEDSWIERYGSVALTGEPVHFENYSRELDRYYEVTAYCPGPGQFAVIFSDVTRRKQAEDEREELVKELDAKNKDMQSIVYVASHDLRSPLVNIQGFAGELERDCQKLLELTEEDCPDIPQIKKIIIEHFPESLKFIKAGTNKIDSLVKGLLHLSRVGTVEINIKKLDVNGKVSKVVDTMKFQLQSNDISLTCDDLPDCLGDEIQINQVFSNLIGNAIKYLDPARKGSIRISGKIEDGKSVYCVQDNGVGIDKEHQDRVFEIFHRLNPGGPIEGEGLGLTIVSRILARQNGRIWLESQPGEGSKFFFSLPNA